MENIEKFVLTAHGKELTVTQSPQPQPFVDAGPHQWIAMAADPEGRTWLITWDFSEVFKDCGPDPDVFPEELPWADPGHVRGLDLVAP